MARSKKRTLRTMYDLLWSAYGPQHWWPARTAAEMVIGAILTQNTAWKNVEHAIENLRRARALTWIALRDLATPRLAELIRSSGTFRVKAARLKTFVQTLWTDHGGSLEEMLAGRLNEVRQRLLAISGIGPETADAILLYAGIRPTFVVDAYTRRILRRHHVTDMNADYEMVHRLFHVAIPPDARVYGEYHALLVAVGKNHCRARACCAKCPLAPLPHNESL